MKLLYIAIEGDPASTKYIPGSRPNLMKLNLSDVKRFSNKTKKKILQMSYYKLPQGDLLFYTNNNHRGAYTDSEAKEFICVLNS